MKNKLTLLLVLIFAFAVACTPDAVPTPRPVDDDDGNRPRTQEVEPTAVPPTAAPTPEPDAEQEPLQTISAANFPTLASVPSRPLVLMDQVGGAAKAVALADDVAFAGEGLRVTAVSLTDPTNLAVLGRSEPLGGVVQRLALYQDAAFVVAEPGWIDVLDVSNPAQMRRIAQLPIRGEMQDMVVAGDYLYTTAVLNDETILSVWDISGMVTAVYTTNFTLPINTPSRLTINGELLFVTVSEQIEIFDITNQGQPVLVGEISGFAGFSVNPVLPLADGRLLYANEFYQQFNISNPAVAEQIASAPLGAILTGDDFPRRGGFLNLQGKTAVLIDTGYYYAPAGPSRLWGIDTTAAEPTPQLIAELPFTVNDVSYRGTLAIVAHENGVTLIDLANATAPTFLSELNWGAATAVNGEIVGFATGSDAPNSVLQFDLSDLKSRDLFLALQTFNYGSVVMGNAQFVLDPDAGYPGAGLVQLDVSDPLRPVETAVIDERSNTLHRVGSYVITTGNNLQTFTLNDAGLLEQVAVCEDCYEGGVREIVAAGLDILHLIGPDGISIVAVPGGPDFVYYDFFATDFPLLDGVTEALRNATYYVGTTCSGTDLDCTESTLLTLNTGVAHEPEVTSRLIIPGNARKLVMFDGLLWVMTVDGRFIPHILTDPFAPQMLNKGIQLPLRSTLVQTEVIGDRLFISHPDTGILVYQMAEE